ncbi:hat family dimerization domain [Plakobranchus ocellatus]|uniref:Hat family dimerization domain n=1 Tax=Plakobranchus ocellatus TaxID=259542 RepID=A0AAV4A4B2_9GAST|nr:hat family dimerization domain [Plakobranchus ocellatus]
MEVFKEFIGTEIVHAGCLAPNSLKELQEAFQSEEELMVIKGQMQYIRDKSALFVDATNLFQSQSPMAMSLILLPESLKDLEGIPGLEDIPEVELANYRQNLGPAAVKNSPTGAFDRELFWKSCAGSRPGLSQLADRYMFATVHSADAERSFSMYNLILSDRRRSLSTETLRGLTFLYYNKFAGRDFFD